MSEQVETDAIRGIYNDNNHQNDEYMAKSSQLFPRSSSMDIFPSPNRPLVFLIITILVVEGFIELVIMEYFDISIWSHIFLDSGFMIILLSPFFYYFLYRPYKMHHDYHTAAQAQIHYLSRQLINISENERKLLSQNLHDDFGQVLTAMQFGVETLKSSCLVSEAENSICLAQTEKLSQQISALGDFVRQVSTGLYPHMLEELGLEATLKWHLDEFTLQYRDIKIESSFSGIEMRFPPEIELAVFRVCQEALNNIVKHAKAKKVTLKLGFKDGFLDLYIKDDGVGFDLERLKSMGAKRSGIGLLGMRERTADLGGLLHLDSTQAKGTSLHAKIPMQLRRRKNEAYPGPDC
jgi:signal transduction histidine kinase